MNTPSDRHPTATGLRGGKRQPRGIPLLGSMYCRSVEQSFFSLFAKEKGGASLRDFWLRGTALPGCGGCCCCGIGVGVGGGPLERCDVVAPMWSSSPSSMSGTPALKMSMASERSTDGDRRAKSTNQINGSRRVVFMVCSCSSS